MSIHGPPGSGKSCLQHLLLNNDPPDERISTNVTTRAIRAATYTASQSAMIMSEVSESNFLCGIAQGIKDKQADYLQEESQGWLSRISAQFKGYVSVSHSPAHSPLVSTAREMLSLLPTEEPSRKLFDARWVFSIDSGGQAAFQDIAPAFLRCNSINIITLR